MAFIKTTHFDIIKYSNFTKIKFRIKNILIAHILCYNYYARK